MRICVWKLGHLCSDIWSIGLTEFGAGETQSREYSLNCGVGC